jgi:decaprenylphospho-beta-D-erythro-pentofuranosid-2-ulose 2-reductase
MQKILIIGATSEIAQATARLFASRGNHLFLLARNTEKLNLLCTDLTVRGAHQVHSAAFDADNLASHADLIQTAKQALGSIDIVLIAHGTLPDQTACEKNIQQTLVEFNTNALSVISLLTHLAVIFEQQGAGTIAVISSVAGDRGRQSNYIYGAAKGCLSIFLQGLRNRLYKKGVHVLTIKPGFVNTVMTKDFKKGALWAQPDQIAQGIVKAIEQQKNVAYLPWFWRYIMLIICHIPESLFKRLSL